VLVVPPAATRADVGVFGGSGFYSLLDHLEPVSVETPYGPPSEPPVLGDVGGRTVAFLPRHGNDHRYPAHAVNYRANVWAMAALGVSAVIGPFACGSLRRAFAPGHVVLVDQQVDRTHSRSGTFHDGPETVHLPFADPYDAELGTVIAATARRQGLTVHEGGTVVVIPGPRFSTRAESASYAAAGWDLVNMTQAPEAALCAEAGLRYAGVGLVTDYDVGSDADPDRPAVTMEEVFAVLDANAAAMRDLLVSAVPRLAI
jgi:5'-methylthioadenosine phosphorylase